MALDLLSALPISLRQLQYIVAVAEFGGFRRAAEACHVAQPSLSAQVAVAERALVRRAAACFTVLAAIVHVHAQPAPDNACVDCDRLYAAIRDAKIDRQLARREVRALLPRIRDYFNSRGGTLTPPAAWRFPLDGYTADAIGGRNGSGYVADGYDYFDGYKSHGHPGHDLFIHDQNPRPRDIYQDLLRLGSRRNPR